MRDRRAQIEVLQHLKDAYQAWALLPKPERLAVLRVASSFPWYFAGRGTDPLTDDEVRAAIDAAQPEASKPLEEAEGA